MTAVNECSHIIGTLESECITQESIGPPDVTLKWGKRTREESIHVKIELIVWVFHQNVSHPLTGGKRMSLFRLRRSHDVFLFCLSYINIY